MSDNVIYVGECAKLQGRKGRIVATEPVLKAPDYHEAIPDQKWYIVELDTKDFPQHWPRHWRKYRASPEEVARF